MSETTLRNKVDSNLASGTQIQAIKHRELEHLIIDELFAIIVTRSQAVAILNANALKSQRWYNITNAEGGSSNVFTLAVSGSSFSGLAVSPTHPGKVFKYDLTGDILTEIGGQVGSVWASENW